MIGEKQLSQRNPEARSSYRVKTMSSFLAFWGCQEFYKNTSSWSEKDVGSPFCFQKTSRSIPIPSVLRASFSSLFLFFKLKKVCYTYQDDVFF
jgi:hypothetical protein